MPTMCVGFLSSTDHHNTETSVLFRFIVVISQVLGLPLYPHRVPTRQVLPGRKKESSGSRTPYPSGLLWPKASSSRLSSSLREPWAVLGSTWQHLIIHIPLYLTASCATDMLGTPQSVGFPVTPRTPGMLAMADLWLLFKRAVLSGSHQPLKVANKYLKEAVAGVLGSTP